MIRLARVGVLVIGGMAAIAVAATTVAGAATIGVETRFDYVAEFPPATDGQQIEGWRRQVLGRVHQSGCIRGLPCVARTMRLMLPDQSREVIAFDLMPMIPIVEKTALLEESTKAIPGVLLHRDARPVELAAKHQ